MPAAIQMIHDVDPKDEIRARVTGLVDDVVPMGTGVLIGVYVRPERTRGGIILPDNGKGTKQEDNYQGKAGLVLAMGPAAFLEDATHKWGGRTPAVGDWVAINVGDTWSFELGNQRCRVVEDVDVKLILQRPDIVM